MIKRMWKLYFLAWLPFGLLMAFAEQGKALAGGSFDLAKAGLTFVWLLPIALLLMLAWPVGGYLKRRGVGSYAMVGIHTVLALLFAVGWLCMSMVMMPLMGVNKMPPLYVMVWPFLFYMLIYGVVAGAFHAIRANEDARIQSEAAFQAQGLLVASELTALRNKLNPHFLFNTLHSIIALTRKNSQGAEAALLKFSDMLRYVLDTEKSGSDRVTLDEEMHFVRDYLDLEALRLGPRLNIEWDIDPEAASVSVPALSIQPLVENSIKYAFNPRSQAGNLTITAYINEKGSHLAISVRDDGPGAVQDKVYHTGGLGVKTVARRLALEYGERASFTIETAPGAGFEVRLLIPV
jgi:LytS/YehU family sensor histidine kinase